MIREPLDENICSKTVQNLCKKQPYKLRIARKKLQHRSLCAFIDRQN